MKKRKKDIMILLVIVGLIFLSLGINYIFFQDRGDIYCEIYVDGELVETVDLTVDKQFSIAERPEIVFEIKDHAIAFIESDCPDKVCVHSGYLGHTGQSASCLPNKTTIRIYSDNQETDDPDMVVGLHAAAAADGGMDEE